MDGPRRPQGASADDWYVSSVFSRVCPLWTCCWLGAVIPRNVIDQFLFVSPKTERCLDWINQGGSSTDTREQFSDSTMVTCFWSPCGPSSNPCLIALIWTPDHIFLTRTFLPADDAAVDVGCWGLLTNGSRLKLNYFSSIFSITLTVLLPISALVKINKEAFPARLERTKTVRVIRTECWCGSLVIGRILVWLVTVSTDVARMLWRVYLIPITAEATDQPKLTQNCETAAEASFIMELRLLSLSGIICSVRR